MRPCFKGLRLPKSSWKALNVKVHQDIALIRRQIFQQQLPLSYSCAVLWSAVQESLLSDPTVKQQATASPPQKYRSHRSAALLKLSSRKNALRAVRHRSEADNQDFLNAVRAHNNLLAKVEQKKKENSILAAEQSFRKDPYKFSKRLLEEQSERAEPAFDKLAAETFLRDNYGSPKDFDVEKLERWLKPLPDSQFTQPYNPAPVRPCHIRAFLKKRKSNSAPGPDGMTYAILKFLPCLHPLLATIFTRMRAMESPKAQEGWETSNSILIFKSGVNTTMENFRRIGLSNVMGKLFNALVSRDLTEYLTSNCIIDTTMQKAFIPGLDGCREHTMVDAELVKNARKVKRSLYLTSLDLRDAFGSTAHSLIVYLLRWARVPEPVCRYIADFLARLRTRVTTRQWETEPVPIQVGTMQGDTLSPILFLLVINPIIMYLQQEEIKHGYRLTNADSGETKNFISTPFADDFNLITRDPRSHARILRCILSKLEDLRLTLKIPKCVSLGLKSGSFTAQKFFLNDIQIPTADKKDLVILGMYIPARGGLQSTFARISDNVTSSLKKIDESPVRGEYKARIFSEFYLLGLQYLLTVHRLGSTHYNDLNALGLRYLRKWLSIPPSATRPLFSSAVFDFEPTSKLASRAIVGAHTRMREMGDGNVNCVLDTKIAREEELKHDGMKPTVNAERIYSQAKRDSPDAPCKSLIQKARNIVNTEHEGLILQHLSSLSVQGKFSEIIDLQRDDHFFRAVMWDLPHKQLSWLMRACVDCLPSFANLRRWGKQLSDKCALCPRRETMFHCLTNCSPAIEQGRLTFRHDSILLHIVKQLHASKCKKRIIADVSGHKLQPDGTIPPDVIVTLQKPDLVLVDSESKCIALYELTSCADKAENIRKARERKINRYSALVGDLVVSGWNATLTPIQVCALGDIDGETRTAFNKLFGKNLARKLCKKLTRIAISASYRIFYSRREVEWHDQGLIELAVD